MDVKVPSHVTVVKYAHDWKHEDGNTVIDTGTDTDTKCENAKQKDPNDVMDAGNIMLVSDEHELKLLDPNEVTVLGSVTVVKDAHESKQEVGIEVHPVGMVAVTNAAHPWKQEAPSVVTLFMETVVSAVHCLKHSAGIEVTREGREMDTIPEFWKQLVPNVCTLLGSSQDINARQL